MQRIINYSRSLFTKNKPTTAIAQASTMSSKHQAAILPSQGGPLSLADRPTPTPGPDEILIEVKALALNPIDYYQRDFGMPPVPIYPAVLGSDTSGLIAKLGSNVTNAPAIGSRAIAFASAFYQNGSPNHGAFQKYVLARAEGVIPLPDFLSFEQGAIFPLAVLTAMSGWTTIGLSLDTKYTPADKQAVLIWGGSSSVGTFAVQSAKSLGFTVYTTASPKHHEYVKSLGADAVFDYHSDDVVAQILAAVKADGVTLTMANVIVDGGLQPTLDVLKATKGDKVAKVAHTPALLPGHPELEGVEITFNLPPMDQEARDKHIGKTFQGWLKAGLEKGTVVPSPHVQVEKGGLDGLNQALDTLKAGVSGTKVVVSV